MQQRTPEHNQMQQRTPEHLTLTLMEHLTSVVEDRVVAALHVLLQPPNQRSQQL